MKTLMIRFAKGEECRILSNLSKMFAEENCCNNILPDSEDFFPLLFATIRLWDIVMAIL